MKINDRFKNPYFWLGLIGVIFTAAGVSVESLTSWDVLAQDLISIIANPFLLLSVFAAVLGVFVDPTTKGLVDCKLNSDKKNQE